MPICKRYGFIWRCSVRRWFWDSDVDVTSFFIHVPSYFTLFTNCPYRYQIIVVLWIVAIYYLIFSFLSSKGQRQWRRKFFIEPRWDFCVYNNYCIKALASLLHKCAADLHRILASGIISYLDLLSALVLCSVAPSHCIYALFRSHSSNYYCILKSSVSSLL